ncbi:hypothetical protein AMTR_s00025p00213610 [Amborella trichopoda]|uniref:DUF8040 domain-containing protein n=1 Tax=Amborella trichopoda TaxID=13333 RepID=W1PRB1_AMBTC|nr:hypothetical protein AMTR_s00025p00213610 [Amborella trichopoda]
MEMAKRHEKQRHKRRLIIALARCSYNDIYVNKIPLRNSSLSGYVYMEEVLKGHRERCLQVCRMELNVFQNFCEIFPSRHLLNDTRGVKVEEQLAMFFYIMGKSSSNRSVQYQFQNSGETVSHHLERVLNAIHKLSFDYAHLPSSSASP